MKAHPAAGAPFFAPSGDQEIDTALELVGLERGERLLDLGCGDGRVLAAAGRQGAIAVGVEWNPELVRLARTRLAEADPGTDATVIEADMYTVDLQAFRPDVVFTFLTHSSLQSLTPRLLRLRAGTRVVAVGTPVPGWVASRSRGAVFLYELPPTLAPIEGAPSWRCPGLAVILPVRTPVVTSFEVVHPAGPVGIYASPELAVALAIRVGRDELPATGLLAIDLYWTRQPVGTCLRGSLRSEALGRLPIVAVYSDTPPYGSAPIALDPR